MARSVWRPGKAVSLRRRRLDRRRSRLQGFDTKKPAAGDNTRRALLFIRSGRFLPETPEIAEAISLAGRNASFLTLSIDGTPKKRGKTR